MSLINEIINKRFNAVNLPLNIKNNIKKLIGPISNLNNIRTIHKINFRIILDQYKRFRFKIVNSHFQERVFNYDSYLKSFLRTYSDGIFISDKIFCFNSHDYNFEQDIDTLGLKSEIFSKFSNRIDKKKPLGILMKDIRKNFFIKNTLFENELLYKNIICKADKLEKIKKTDANFMNNIKANFSDVDSINIPKLIDGLEIFFKKNKSQLVLVEGFEEEFVDNLHTEEIHKIPSDFLILTFVKDGEVVDRELGSYFEDSDILMQIYTKLFQSEIFHSDDGGSWFFVVFKKNLLVDKSTIISDKHNDNIIASKLFPDNFSSEGNESVDI